MTNSEAVATAKAEWKRCDFRCRRNVVRVSQERTLEGRLFQIAGAAERRPRAPNEMLQPVTGRINPHTGALVIVLYQ